ncbi:MAG: hypothetical protein A3D32_07955 [Candidatus Muproteobacteria bacterium RIFCSPHIGHO2_02_FULL_60_13]|nr:MAG: hypothetical protein A3D32_07955 [Candidatus Muproteobacteria bacterium RIFCSPHIGHO2_02_FULL_60_13]
MKRIAGYFLWVTLLSLPAQAIGPLAFIAKDLVKGIVRSFVEGQIDKMLASAGPCGLPIAGPGAGGLAGMLGGRGAMPGLSSMRGAGKMPLSGAAGAAKGTLPSMPGVGGGMAIPPGMEGMMKEQMAQAQAMMAKEQAEHGADVQDKESPGSPGAVPDMATAMQAMQAMQDSPPLTSAEVDELATLLERMATAMPSAAPQCKPGELKTVLQQASDSPMGGGVLRMMLGSMRDMQKNLDEARATFAKMPEAERSEYVETMAAEFRGWDKDNKQALLGMVKTNFLGMPDTMKTQLLARLKQAK